MRLPLPPAPARSESEHVFPHTNTRAQRTASQSWINTDRNDSPPANKMASLCSPLWLIRINVCQWEFYTYIQAMDPSSNYHRQSVLQLALGPWSSQVLAPGHMSPWGHSPSWLVQTFCTDVHTLSIPPITGLDTQGHPAAGLQITLFFSCLMQRQTYKLVSVDPRPTGYSVTSLDLAVPPVAKLSPSDLSGICLGLMVTLIPGSQTSYPTCSLVLLDSH